MERKAGALVTAALLLATLSSCSGDGSAPISSPTSTATSPSITSSPSPTETKPPTDSEAAAKAASVLVRQFYSVRNELRQNPQKPLKLLSTVAISTELAAQENLVRNERRDGLRQTGDTQIAELKVQSVNLDNSDPKAGKVPTVQVDICFDVSDVDVIDENGKSVVSADRPDTGWIRYLVANYKWDSDPAGAWRVASSQDIERTPCAAS